MMDSTERTWTETVLLVDDDPLVRNVLERALTSRGFTVLPAVNGEDALRVADEYKAPIHLVISDVVMPDMDGPELFRLLRGWYPGIRFLFISGQMDGAMADVSVDGRTAFLPKPFSVESLLAFVGWVLDGGAAFAFSASP